jgi:hypothetical protein
VVNEADYVNPDLGMAVGLDGTGHVVFYNSQFSKLIYAKGTESGWQTREIVTLEGGNGFAGTSDIGLSPTDAIHISFHDGNNRLMHAALDGETFNIEEIANTPYVSHEIAVDPAGNVHLVYIGAAEEVMHAFRYQGDWIHHSIDIAECEVPSLTIDQDGRVHIGYYKHNLNEIRYATNRSGSYLVSTVDEIWTEDIDIALNAAGVPHLVYTNGNKIYMGQLENGTWTVETIRYLLYFDGNVVEGIEAVALKFDSQGAAHVGSVVDMYHDGYYSGLDFVSYSTNASGDWFHEGRLANTGSDNVEIALDDNGRARLIHIGTVYEDDVAGPWVTQQVCGNGVGPVRLNPGVVDPPLEGTTACISGCVMSLTASGIHAGLDVEWTPVEGAVNYHLYVGTQVPSPHVYERSFTTSNDHLRITGLNQGTLYYVVITADDGPESMWVSARTLSSSDGRTFPSYPSSHDFAVPKGFANLGDVNGDGSDDFALGFPEDNGGYGKVEVYLGDPSGAPDQILVGDNDSWWASNLGRTIETAGDVNNDGYADVLINYERTKVRLYLGSPDGLISEPASTINRGDDDGFAGYDSMCAAGDINGDGFGDVVTGARHAEWFEDPVYSRGRFRVFLGNSTGLNSYPDADIMYTENPWKSSSLGQDVRGLGDVNNDGFDDIAVTAPNYNYSSGTVLVYFGSVDGIDEEPNQSAVGTDSNRHVGSELAAPGDLNGDGYDDMIFMQEDLIYICLGGEAGLTSQPMPLNIDGRFGEAPKVSDGFDINMDGRSDVFLWSNVRARILLGTPDIFSPHPIWVWDRQQEPFVSRIIMGDFNNDGLQTIFARGFGYYIPDDFYRFDEEDHASGTRVWAGWPETLRPGELLTMSMASLRTLVSPVSCVINFGDGSSPVVVEDCNDELIAAVEHRYSQEGHFPIRVEINDTSGVSAGAATVVSVQAQ